MTRAESIALCWMLRDDGLSVREISKRTGIPRSTVGNYLLGDEHSRRYRDSRKVRCECGALMERRARQCRACLRRSHLEQRRTIERMWNDGCTEPEITAALGWKADNLGTVRDDMRREGYHLPYRYTTGLRAGSKYPEQLP